MMTMRSITAAALATAMLATSAPAIAQGYPGYGYGYGYGNRGYGNSYRYDRYRRHHQDNTGAVVLGVIGIGVLAAIIGSAAKDSQRRQQGYGGYQGRINSESTASEACVSAAEARLGNGARVTGIDNVYRTGDGFGVTGVVALRDTYDERGYDRGYRQDDRQTFRCTVRQGAVDRVDFGSYAANY